MSDEIAIHVNRVSKDFMIPHERNTSVKQAFLNVFRSSMHKNVNRQHALKDISFDIKKGEFFGIVGRNGCGKSTLLKMIAGIYQPTKGNIQINGKLVPFIELGVGFNPELTGRQNVYLNGALLGFSEKEVRAMYDDIVEFAELHNFMDQKLKNYSSGMQVRLAFSMAIRADADILLIDEVLAVGDANFQRKCFDYFKLLKKKGKTVILVSHDMNAVQQYCDRAVLVDHKKLILSGTPAVVAEEYLKLFEDTVPKQHQKSSGEDRWGDGTAVIKGYRQIINDKSIAVEYVVQAHRPVDNVVAGFRVRNLAGEPVLGTNTKKEKQNIGPLKQGESRLVTWRFPNILSDDKYIVDPSLVYEDEITVYDWWNEAGHFTVNRNRNLPFVVDPGFELFIKKP